MASDIDIKKCIICQKISDNTGSKKLSSTENGRSKLTESSEILGDNLINNLDTEKKLKIQYHPNTCYQKYIRQAQRTEEKRKKTTEREREEKPENETKVIHAPQSKRRRSSVEMANTMCIVCNQKKCKGETKLYRVCVVKRAKQLLRATNYFKDDVHTRCIYLESPDDVFAADIMYHNHCLSGYLLKFKREIESMMAESDNDDVDDVKETIDNFISKLEMTTNYYNLSDVRDDINKMLKNTAIGMFNFFSLLN